MLAKKYKSELVSIINPIKDIYTLELKSLGKPYKYHPGQFLHLAIDEEYDGVGQWPDSRCFSMQSNPSQENIRITYAVKGSFTNQMKKTLKIGSKVWLKLPYGDLFTQPHSKDNTVFIAGGTGITPFLSLFSDVSFNEYKNPKVYLGFRSKVFNIYEKEFDFIKAQIERKEFFFNIYYEDVDGSLNIANIFSENGIENNYFISGPPIMIKTFKHRLSESGVNVSNILSDDWE